MSRRTVLVVGDYRQTLTIARALRRRGDLVVAGIDRAAQSHVLHSRAVDARWHHPPLDDPNFGGALEWALASHRPDVVFPVGDREIRWFAARSEHLGVPLASVSRDVAEACQDKPRLLAKGAEVGVAFTDSEVAAGLDDLARIAGSLGFPCVVKSNDPLQRVLGSKGIICRSREELHSRIPTWPETHETLIVQRYLDGPRHNLYFAAQRGELLGLVEVEILRTDRPDGTGYAVDGITRAPTPALYEQTAALIGELKYHGVGCTQFLVGSDGTTSFLELNPRLGANYVVADAAGLDLAGLAVDLVFDDDVGAPADPAVGLRYAWSLGELAGLRTLATAGEIDARAALAWVARTVGTALAADVHVTWSWRDPVPSLALLWRDILRPAVRAATRKLRRP